MPRNTVSRFRYVRLRSDACEEGWSAIAGWTGVPLRVVLEAAGVLPSERFVNFFAYDDSAEGIDMLDASRPETFARVSRKRSLCDPI
jgi:DMSO/TMAO reductase YedYZ molybdopterin-dependent catalytic subunit